MSKGDGEPGSGYTPMRWAGPAGWQRCGTIQAGAKGAEMAQRDSNQLEVVEIYVHPT